MYFNSNPSVEDCLAECQKITKIADYYLPLCDEIFSDYQSKTLKKEYGVGGECIHRGYYCPDIILDIIIGNLNRGKIYKNTTPKNPTYIYGFDENGNLLTIQKTDCSQYEIIIFDNQEEIGITFSVFEGQPEITSISVCGYIENKIASYSNFLINGFDSNRVSEFQIHNYEYSDSNMIVRCYNFMNSCNGVDNLINDDNEIKNIVDNFLISLKLPTNCISNTPTIDCDVYDFKIIDGYLNSYTIKGVENIPDNTIYEVNLRRKV